MTRFRWSLPALLAGAVFVLVGCGGGPTNVSGKVNYRGAPVTGGSVKLVFGNGKDFTGPIQGNGDYVIQVQGASGNAAVGIETESARVSVPGGPDPKAGRDKTDNLTAAMPQYMKIPDRYADPKSSGFTVDVKGANVIKNFELND